MRWWECVPDRHRDEFQMQAVASGEIPCFIESQKMKTCKNGGEEGRRGKVKCTRSPHESYLHFLSTVFSYIFSPKSTHFSLALQFFFSLPLFCLILSTFNYPPQCLLNPHLSLFFPPPIQSPSADLVRVVWFRHQRGNGGAFMHYITSQHYNGRNISASLHSMKRMRLPMFHKVKAASHGLT